MVVQTYIFVVHVVEYIYFVYVFFFPFFKNNTHDKVQIYYYVYRAQRTGLSNILYILKSLWGGADRSSPKTLFSTPASSMADKVMTKVRRQFPKMFTEILQSATPR